jgi:hypothetical protein
MLIQTNLCTVDLFADWKSCNAINYNLFFVIERSPLNTLLQQQRKKLATSGIVIVLL